MVENQEIQVDDLLTLKRITPNDSEVMFSLIDKGRSHLSQFGDETAAKYPTLGSIRERNITQDPSEHRFGIWDQASFVGFIKVTDRGNQRMEIGYWLGEEFTGKGYMTRAVIALTNYARENLGAAIIYAKVAKENSASIKVLENASYHLIRNNPEEPEDVVLEFP